MTDNNQDETKSENIVVARVSLKVPPFWKPDPRIWFLQLEAQFRNANITADQTRYDYVVSSIEAEILSQVSDILVNPPKDDKYIVIKNRLISVFADTETQKTQKLLTELELGDRKPSQLLCEMRNLAGDKVSGAFLKTLWLQRLPVNMRSILSVSCDDLSKLATMADQIWELNPVTPQIASVTPYSITPNAIESMQRQIAELSLQISQLNRKRDFSPYRRNRSISRNRSYTNNRDSDICYYHKRFGVNAFKCAPPCKFSNKSQENESEN